MKIIICGAGQVGWQIARHLASEKNDVTVVDTESTLIRRATEALDVTGMTGFASHPDVLARAGADDADMIIAATHSDEVNIATCLMAHGVFGIRRKIARLRDESYLQVFEGSAFKRELLPVDVVISPEREVADSALQRLEAPAAFDTERFCDGQVMLVGLTIDENCPVINTPLRQLTELFSTLKAVVTGIRRAGRLFVPVADDQIFPEDEVYLLAQANDLPRVFEIFGKSDRRIEKLVIIGGGYVGAGVARALEERGGMRVKMIERNRAAAEEAADSLSRTIVLHGDGLDISLLEEADVAGADAVLVVTDDDKTNMLAAVRAKQLGARMTICLSNDPTLVPLMTKLGIDAFINPRASTVSSILRHIRHGRVRWVYSIGDAEAEVIEAQVLGTSPISGERVRDIAFPQGAHLGAIIKRGVYVKPTPDVLIEEGDIVCIFALAREVPEVERLLQVSIEFF